MFRRDAYGADWSKTAGLPAYNAKGSDGVYHISTVGPDGMNAVQLGAGSASFPQRTTGTPVWSPSGRFLAFVAEKSAHPGNSVGATPGWGSYSDLWVATFDVSQDGTLSLSDIRTISPAGDAFNETGGFSADSSSLVFTRDFETHNFWRNQIYRYDFNSAAATRLTRGDSYNEHPRYTPDGQVVWMSTADNPSRGTDWWTMSPDGSNPQRLSDFNAGDNARAFGRKQVYATVVQTANWSPDKSYFYGDVETNLLTSDSVIVRAALTCHGP